MADENFPVAMRILPAQIREDLLALYRYARHVDDVGDESAGERAVALKSIGMDVRRMYDGGRPEIDEVADLRSMVQRHRIPIDPWLDLVEANLMDQKVNRYDTFDNLLEYCALSANPVGRLVLHLFDSATPERIALSDRVCTGLQLIEHWQDLREDCLRDRVYVPQEDLHRFGVSVQDLGKTRAAPELVALVGFETDRALCWLDSGAALVSTLHGWARIAVSGYVNGGRAAADGLRRCGYDPLPGVPKPTTAQIAATWLRNSVRSAG